VSAGGPDGPASMRIRAHNLLCIQGFVGKGYSPAFVANMTRVVAALDGDAQVTVTDEPDALCASCPNLAASGCALHGEGTERGSDVLARIAAHVAPSDLDAICGACPWLPLGHCRAGLARLKEAHR
jgi:hypothetical protein